MRRVPLLLPALAVTFGASLAPHGAHAQAFYIENLSQPAARSVQHTGSVGQRAPAGPPPGAYGGGFIELLMTGRDPTPYVGQPGFPPRHGASGADPMTGQPVARPSRQQQASVNPRAAIEPAIERAIDPQFLKQEVAYNGPHRPGTIIIDTPQRFLFLVMPNGRALRYGIGVGRPGFEWAGAKSVTRKAEWPDWRPPEAMLRRRPDLPRFMEGGPDNPMGARALYLGSSLYRIHGTNEPHTIGQAVSSGCIRMTNDDVIDLYSRVRVGARVIVI
jgi:lipoprotein-anchoring transpeptidase ErfK/SrfK